MLVYASIFTDYPWKDIEEIYKRCIPLLAEDMGRLKPRDCALQKAGGLENILSIRVRGLENMQTLEHGSSTVASLTFEAR